MWTFGLRGFEVVVLTDLSYHALAFRHTLTKTLI